VYDRTYTNTGGGPTAGSDPASVTGLRLDEYLVTVGRFRPFVEAVKPTDAGPAGWTPSHASGKHTHLNHGKGLVALGVGVDAGSGVDAAGVDAGATFYEPGWDPADDVHLAPTDGNLTCGKYATWTSAAGAQEDLPINCTNWYEAYAFCIWDGGFLPSEAEWEYTAAGGSEELEYPWGSVDAGTTNRYAIYGCYYPSGLGTCTGVGNIAPVGTPPDGEGRWGQRDMAGELWEWTLDWYAAAYGNPCIDCAYLGTSTTKVIRGGGYGLGADNMVPPYRHDNAPTVRGFGNGFRCARVP
jgi:formylglycine-generating enzyme required for sulfatase activity